MLDSRLRGNDKGKRERQRGSGNNKGKMEMTVRKSSVAKLSAGNRYESWL